MSRIVLALVATLVWFAPSDAQAIGPCGSGLGCNGFQGVPGYGVNILPYSLGRVPVPPYFALHPPVYYSQPVPRPYGYSPYAYPGSVRTPEIEVPQSAMIENPHVTPQKVAEKTDQHTVSSEMIFNPYITQGLAAQ